jgi:GNAT superfamily N-acetyltransferase
MSAAAAPDLAPVAPAAVAFRPVVAGDADFLGELYASTRWEEIAATGWPDAQKRAFLAQQFGFQTADWARGFPHAARQLILVEGAPAGRLYVNRSAADRALNVIDIALLPAWRGRGIGTRIFHGLVAEAEALGWKISLHVEPQNPARRLYARLGFAPVRDTGVYLLLERAPLSAPRPPAAAS